MKIVINTCYGGFGLSDEAVDKYAELKGIPNDGSYRYINDIERDDPILVHVVEELGEKANGLYAELNIINIPNDVVWHVDEYDGMESIHEDHRSWYYPT